MWRVITLEWGSSRLLSLQPAYSLGKQLSLNHHSDESQDGEGAGAGMMAWLITKK
jgi:hypothetical protein